MLTMNGHLPLELQYRGHVNQLPSSDNTTDIESDSSDGCTAAEGNAVQRPAGTASQRHTVNGDNNTYGTHAGYIIIQGAMGLPEAHLLHSPPHGAGHSFAQGPSGIQGRYPATDETGRLIARSLPGQYSQSRLAVNESPLPTDGHNGSESSVSHVRRVDTGTAHSANQRAAPRPTTTASTAAQSSVTLGSSWTIQQSWQPVPGPYAAPQIYQPAISPASAPPLQTVPMQVPPADQTVDHPICGLEGCSIHLDDLTVGGQRRHLRDFHAAQLQHGRVRCNWVHGTGGIICGKELDANNWGKHLAAVHYGSTAEKCPHCPKVICRSDALKRHVDNFHFDQ
ncbi:uncharacterized protein B0H18DRAFT_966576 [Fomitopsis serialis]|uniref:uncharacterized protein n=1 Tax=Fomitopsis serialis TaxID=139415 RepID=UPI0020077D5A|nr:uncharacterized protein B0H18DRAFT_966576 [Neoantrodia serialis]KAH9938318.1 hypothetical protein B0H18DRAFT_966576 [Neoantrodia serialis]